MKGWWMSGRGLAMLCSVVLAIAACSTAEQDQEAASDLEGLTERFQATLDELWTQARSTDESFPGATAAFITADGQVVGIATGHSDVEGSVPMRPDMRMPSGSIGKTYVAAVALSLAHEGLVDLDAPIGTWVGEEDWFTRVPNAPDLTLRSLLNHSGGLVDHVFDVPDFETALKDLVALDDPDATLSPRELLEFALDREALFPVGQGYDYTDTGYILAGMVMDAASGSPYYAEVQSRHPRPTRTHFHLAAGPSSRAGPRSGIRPRFIPAVRLALQDGRGRCHGLQPGYRVDRGRALQQPTGPRAVG